MASNCGLQIGESAYVLRNLLELPCVNDVPAGFRSMNVAGLRNVTQSRGRSTRRC